MINQDNVSCRNNSTEIHDLITEIIDHANKLRATAVEVTANVTSGLSIKVRNNKIETIERNAAKNLEVTVYFGHHFGTATTSDLSRDAINITLEKACYIARFTEEDLCIGLAKKELMAYHYPNLDLYHPWPIEITETVEIAKSSEACGIAYNKMIANSEGININTATSLGIYANSHEFYGEVESTEHSINCAFIAKHGNEMQRDYYYTIARNKNDLENNHTIAIMAAERTINRLGAKKILTKKCPVIFSAEIAASIIGNFIAAISGANLYRKTSFLLNSLQKPVFAKKISIEENPHIPKGLGSSPFDAEGVKLSCNSLVNNGILLRYVLDSYSARKLKMNTTGNAGGIHNLIMKPGNLNFEELLKKMDTGLLVTEIMGGGINIVTGDYSRGVFGYWIEHGTIQYPVTGVTVAHNLKDMLLNIIEVGNDIDYRGNILTGSILFEEMTIGGS
jgi:PmbA protein